MAGAVIPPIERMDSCIQNEAVITNETPANHSWELDQRWNVENWAFIELSGVENEFTEFNFEEIYWVGVLWTFFRLFDLIPMVTLQQ